MANLTDDQVDAGVREAKHSWINNPNIEISPQERAIARHFHKAGQQSTAEESVDMVERELKEAHEAGRLEALEESRQYWLGKCIRDGRLQVPIDPVVKAEVERLESQIAACKEK